LEPPTNPGLFTPNTEQFRSQFDPLIVEYVEEWSNYIGLLIFGFIVFNMCRCIVELPDDGSMSWSDAEDEIWVTSLWNLTINRVSIDRSNV